MICSDIWHKYHACYFKNVVHNFTSRKVSEIWGNFEISQVVFMRCFASQASKLVLKFLFSAQLVQTLSQVDVLFSIFWFSEFSFSS